MKLFLSIENWAALSSGLSTNEDWLKWSQNYHHDWSLPLLKPSLLAMMQARRMSIPSRLAVEVALKLTQEKNIDFAIFISRHGELERTNKILSTLNQDLDISPTDFALSVHNTASGLLSIIGKQDIPISSISASEDGFQQALFEAYSLFHQGYKRILLIDFDGAIPEAYRSQINPLIPAYAMGLILTNGTQISIESTDNLPNIYQTNYPQSLAFLHAYLNKQSSFILNGTLKNWLWSINN